MLHVHTRNEHMYTYIQFYSLADKDKTLEDKQIYRYNIFSWFMVLLVVCENGHMYV